MLSNSYNFCYWTFKNKLYSYHYQWYRKNYNCQGESTRKFRTGTQSHYQILQNESFGISNITSLTYQVDTSLSKISTPVSLLTQTVSQNYAIKKPRKALPFDCNLLLITVAVYAFFYCAQYLFYLLKELLSSSQRSFKSRRWIAKSLFFVLEKISSQKRDLKVMEIRRRIQGFLMGYYHQLWLAV